MSHVADPGWTQKAVELVQRDILAVLAVQGTCSVMLTGGRNAAELYATWARKPEFQHLSGVMYYFGDERCVPPDHIESNYGLAMRTLFVANVPDRCSVHRMEADSDDLEAAADRYAAALPTHIDCLLLGVGEDGHIASLFPNSAVLHEVRRRVVPVVCPKAPHQRLTITPPVIRQARSVFVLAAGAAKAALLAEAWRVPKAIEALPARMVLSATWILDNGITTSMKPNSF